MLYTGLKNKNTLPFNIGFKAEFMFNVDRPH